MNFRLDVVQASQHPLAPLFPILTEQHTHQAIVFDPCEDPSLLTHLKDLKVTVTDILITHHHDDHVSGIPSLQREYPDVKIHAPPRYASRIPGPILPVHDGDLLHLQGIDIRVLATPAHTLDQLAFWIKSLHTVVVGDTILPFSTGRLFEGSPQMLWAAIVKLRLLPPETDLYFGHDLLADNIDFTLSIEPNNPRALDLRNQLQTRDPQNTAPLLISNTIKSETEHSLFFRADDPYVASLLGHPDAGPEEVTALLRGRRDQWRGQKPEPSPAGWSDNTTPTPKPSP